MDTAELRFRRRYLYEQNKRYGNALEKVPENEWPKGNPAVKLPPFEVWRSKGFLVQIFQESGVTRMSVCRTELDNDGKWKDGITWDELQTLKAQCGYGDKQAVEIYPADKDKVNVANMRHLWILENNLPFGWYK